MAAFDFFKAKFYYIFVFSEIAFILFVLYYFLYYFLYYLFLYYFIFGVIFCVSWISFYSVEWIYYFLILLDFK